MKTAKLEHSKASPIMFDWAITKECNLNCLHCRGMTKAELSKTAVLKVAKELTEIKPQWVIIEGGEPLTRDGIWETLNILKKGKVDVSLITNGTLLTQENINKLIKLGINIQISIDSPYPKNYEKLRKGAKFEQVIKTVKQLAKTGNLNAINFVLSRDNYKSLEDMFELAKKIGVTLINIIGLKPTKDYRNKLLSPEEYKKAIVLACKSSKKYGIDFFFDEPFFYAACKEWKINKKSSVRKSGIVAPKQSGCIFGKYLFMEPNGDLKPCTFANYVVGNAKQGIKKIWEKSQNSKFISEIKDKSNRKGACKKCKYLDICGGCRSRVYGLTGDWFEYDSACPLTY